MILDYKKLRERAWEAAVTKTDMVSNISHAAICEVYEEEIKRILEDKND